LTSIAFPNISTCVYRFPKQKTAEIAIATVRAFPVTTLREMVFAVFDDENYLICQQLLANEVQRPSGKLVDGLRGWVIRFFAVENLL